MPKKTDQTAEQMLAIATNQREASRKKLAEVYRNEPKLPVTLSPFYAPIVGKNALVSIQGISVYVPADGRIYYVNQSHALQLLDTISRIDAKQQKINRMADVKQNFETSAGALRLV